jgi:hypothetical protein
MAQRGRRGARDGEHHRDHDDGREHDRDRDHKQDGDRHPRRGDGDREESGDNPARQAAVIAQRWVGSVPPTYELYARARQQWLKLPGAMSHPAADVQMPAALPPVMPSPATPEQDNGEGTP